MSIIDYVNNAVIKFSIYYALHSDMCISVQIMIIYPVYIYVDIVDRHFVTFFSYMKI